MRREHTAGAASQGISYSWRRLGADEPEVIEFDIVDHRLPTPAAAARLAAGRLVPDVGPCDPSEARVWLVCRDERGRTCRIDLDERPGRRPCSTPQSEPFELLGPDAPTLSGGVVTPVVALSATDRSTGADGGRVGAGRR